MQQFSAEKNKVQVLRAAAQEVRKEAKTIVPKGQKIRKLSRKNPVTIYPGNLRKSLYIFRTKGNDVQVGPRYLKKIKADDIGRTVRTASGYYAAALAGSATLFRQRYLEPALRQSIEAAFKAADKKGTEVHERLIRKI